MAYDETSIRILDVAAQRDRFSFAAAQALAQDYTHVPVEVIQRLLTAAMMAGADRQAVIEKYLEGNRSIELPQEFTDCYQELVDDARR